MALEIIGRPATEPVVNQRWVCHVAFWVDDVAAKRAELESRGISFETETVVDNDAMKTAFFRDPEGNRCQLVWRSQTAGPVNSRRAWKHGYICARECSRQFHW